jgi:hypothetical protein
MRSSRLIPSSVVVYRTTRPYTPYTKLTKAEWQRLYQEAIRLGFEPLPSVPRLYPMRAIVEHTDMSQGATAENLPLLTPGVLGLSVILFSAQLFNFSSDENPPLLDISSHSPEIPVPKASLALTKQVLSHQDSLLFLSLMVFPVAISTGAYVLPILCWESYNGGISHPTQVGSGYLSQVPLVQRSQLSATLSSCVFTDGSPFPYYMAVTTMNVVPLP